jgi:hypothetical protein
VYGGTIDRLTMMGEAFFDAPVRQQHRAVRTPLDDGTCRTLLLARPRGVDDHGLVALLDGKLGDTHEGGLAAHTDQRRIQRMVGDQPQGAAGAEHVGALVALESEGVATTHCDAPLADAPGQD